DQQQLGVDAADFEHLADAVHQLGDVRLFIQTGDDDREFHAPAIYHIRGTTWDKQPTKALRRGARKRRLSGRAILEGDRIGAGYAGNGVARLARPPPLARSRHSRRRRAPARLDAVQLRPDGWLRFSRTLEVRRVDGAGGHIAARRLLPRDVSPAAFLHARGRA